MLTALINVTYLKAGIRTDVCNDLFKVENNDQFSIQLDHTGRHPVFSGIDRWVRLDDICPGDSMDSDDLIDMKRKIQLIKISNDK